MNDDVVRENGGQRGHSAEMAWLEEFSFPLRLSKGPDVNDLGESFERLTQAIGPVSEPLSVQFTVSDAATWHIDTGPAGCTVTSETKGSPDIELIVDADTWRLIASGTLTPLEAFGRGRMRVRGDLATIRRFARLLQPASDA